MKSRGISSPRAVLLRPIVYGVHLQVMGAPVAGSNVRATVLTGGGLRLKGLVPKLRSRRVQMIFPLAGSERRGLVSLEAKKLKASSSTAFTSELLSPGLP